MDSVALCASSHVRFWEPAEVKFLCATRQITTRPRPPVTSPSIGCGHADSTASRDRYVLVAVESAAVVVQKAYACVSDFSHVSSLYLSDSHSATTRASARFVARCTKKQAAVRRRPLAAELGLRHLQIV